MRTHTERRSRGGNRLNKRPRRQRGPSNSDDGVVASFSGPLADPTVRWNLSAMAQGHEDLLVELLTQLPHQEVLVSAGVPLTELRLGNRTTPCAGWGSGTPAAGAGH